MSHDIFISYSRQDTERMQQVRDGLRETGLSVWTDEGIEPGTESWKRALSDAITGCTSVVVLFSPDAAQSTWVNRELDFAELHQKKIYPLLVRGEVKEALPFGYTTFQFIDIRNDDALEQGLAKLVATLQDEYTDKLLSINPDNDRDKSYQAISPPAQQEVLWKWIETEKLRVSVPATWKISEADSENWARVLLLQAADKNAFYQFLRDENQIASNMIGIPYTRWSRHRVITDISGLEPLTGYIALTKMPIPLIAYFPIVPDIFANIMSSRMDAYLKQHFQMEVTERRWMSGINGRILAITLYGSTSKANIYTFVPNIGMYTVTINVTCETLRFDAESFNYDLMAQSLQVLQSLND